MTRFDATLRPVAGRVRMVASPDSRNATTARCHRVFSVRDCRPPSAFRGEVLGS